MGKSLPETDNSLVLGSAKYSLWAKFGPWPILYGPQAKNGFYILKRKKEECVTDTTCGLKGLIYLLSDLSQGVCCYGSSILTFGRKGSDIELVYEVEKEGFPCSRSSQ